MNTTRPVGARRGPARGRRGRVAQPGGRSACLAAVATSHDALLAVPLSPDGGGSAPGGGRTSDRSSWLRALTGQALGTTPSTGQVAWIGCSGGAEMPQLRGAGGPAEPDGQCRRSWAVAEPRRRLGTRATERRKRDMRLWWLSGLQDAGTDPRGDRRRRRGPSSFYRRRGLSRTRLEILPGHDQLRRADAAILDELLAAESFRTVRDDAGRAWPGRAPRCRGAVGHLRRTTPCDGPSIRPRPLVFWPHTLAGRGMSTLGHHGAFTGCRAAVRVGEPGG
ncbi:hypothetical protein QJS66_01830 [Kocuria rhizophila]|nr:hypothetical protein QJS66_01830 [Kocuria rhizophila]